VAKAKPKTKRLTCEKCRATYDAGAPHEQFCRGCPPLSMCEECGEKHEESFTCKVCGDVSCPDCGMESERLCSVCLSEEEATDA